MDLELLFIGAIWTLAFGGYGVLYSWRQYFSNLPDQELDQYVMPPEAEKAIDEETPKSNGPDKNGKAA